MLKRLLKSETPATADNIEPADDELADSLAGMLEGKLVADDPASPDFDPAYDFAEPSPDSDVPGSVGSLLAKLLEHHRAEAQRLVAEIDTIQERADDAIASRQTVLDHHRAAIKIWGAAQDARVATWAQSASEGTSDRSAEPEADHADAA